MLCRACCLCLTLAVVCVAASNLLYDLASDLCLLWHLTRTCCGLCVQAAKIVMGPGTGLGAAQLMWDEGREAYKVHPGRSVSVCSHN